MTDATQTKLQATVFDFALTELVRLNRDSFQPLWTVDSWVKFLIWMALNCGLSGEQESLELFAEALGAPLTSRMRRFFFERILDDLALKVMADPAEPQILVMSVRRERSISYEQVTKALDQVGLLQRVVNDRSRWEALDAVVAVPWQAAEIIR